jgi:hypothetical protein
MEIGPGFDNRGTIRRWAGLSESAVCRMAGVTRGALVSWESGHEAWISGRFSAGDRGAQQREQVVARLADVYAALMWIAGGCHWPRHLDDAPLRDAIGRMRTMGLPTPAVAEKAKRGGKSVVEDRTIPTMHVRLGKDGVSVSGTCPYCNKKHTHGKGRSKGPDLGHRVSHCVGGKPNNGYVLMLRS